MPRSRLCSLFFEKHRKTWRILTEDSASTYGKGAEPGLFKIRESVPVFLRNGSQYGRDCKVRKRKICKCAAGIARNCQEHPGERGVPEREPERTEVHEGGDYDTGSFIGN